MFVRFLVGVLAISAQRQRYYRFFTGTISLLACPAHPRLYIYQIDSLCRSYPRYPVA